MTQERDSVDFDRYADQYEELLKTQLAFFSKDRGYFSEYKAALAAAHLGRVPSSILDFGCGIGLSLPHLERHFPGAALFATDKSAKSLAFVRRSHPAVQTLVDAELEDHRFEMIFVANVFHHVPVGERPAVVQRLARLLAPGGVLLVFEHNPYNPVTRRMVSTCEFDRDAVLLTRAEMVNLIRESSTLEVEGGGYCLFFPQPLRLLRLMEGLLRWLPLGGQYYVAGRA